MSRPPAKNPSKGIRYWHLYLQLSVRHAFLHDNAEQISTEVQLTKHPLRADILILLNDPEQKLTHPGTHIFRKYNIIEYKSPGKTLDLESYYQGLTYVLVHQLAMQKEGFALDLSTLTFICTSYPRKLFMTLSSKKRTIESASPTSGIYQIHGEDFPVQVIVLNELTNPEDAYAFAPFISESVREKLGLFRRLLQEYLNNPDNENVLGLLDF